MTYYMHFSDNYERLMSPLEDMMKVEADNPQDAVEQVLRDGRGPADRRLRCITVVSAIQNRKDRGSTYWINFDGQPKHLGDFIFWP